MECLKLTYKPIFELRTHGSMPSREAKVVQMFISVDPLAEQAPNWTPYRFGFNNPIMFTDPTGLFEKRSDARKYRRENDIEGRIQRNSEGGFSINDKKNSISYTAGDDSDPTLIDSRPNDGVVESVLVGNGRG